MERKDNIDNFPRTSPLLVFLSTSLPSMQEFHEKLLHVSEVVGVRSRIKTDKLFDFVDL